LKSLHEFLLKKWEFTPVSIQSVMDRQPAKQGLENLKILAEKAIRVIRATFQINV
jgi:hypothetical protein